MPFHPSPNLKLPAPLDGYTLIERLGRGGFGEVWKCEAPGGFLKAVKFVFGDLESNDEGRPAEQELKSLGRVKDIRHPYILTLERYDIIDGQLMVVMELADRNLWDRFRECRMLGKTGIPRDELLRYMIETAEALDLMNDRYKLQHLDIKPQNLFLVFDHIKVADFGLAKAFEGSVAVVTGGVTPVYAAPETFQGEVTRFSDQYSLGIVYQELLTGVRPFNGQNTKQLLLQHLREPPDLSSLPEHDRAIIGRALDKEPSKRWPTCREMVSKLIAAPTTHVQADYGALPLPTTAPSVVTAPLSGKSNRIPPTQPVQTLPVTAFQEARTAPTALPTAVADTVSPPPSRSWGSGFNTPLPSLVTPKMAGPRSAPPVAVNPAATQARRPVIETGRIGTLGIAPPEKTGSGVLFPALVIGVGHTGLEVIRRLRRLITDRFGNPNTLPHVRFLYLDTDVDESNAALAGKDPLPAHQVVLTRLNRPAHYLQREGLPPVEQWLPPNTLYRLPKSPGPAGGVRAFGRLALCDNYRLIAQRIRYEIEPLLTDGPLEKAAADTGLGLRSNRPRIYIIAGLSGGTGGGMFLDLAYLLKHELRNVGYRNPEAYGLLVVPPVDKAVPRPALANTVAALTELNHFSSQQYQMRFDISEPPILDRNPPFERCGLIQWPRKSGGQDHERVVGAVTRAVYLDLFTPVGERADFVRSVAPKDPYSGPTVQPFGMYRLSWPRYELLATITRRFAQRMLRGWSAKEATHLREPIRYWLLDQWTQYRLDPSAVINRLEQAVNEALRGSPEVAFEAAVAALCPPGGGRVDGMAAALALDQLIKLVGKPEVEASSNASTIQQIVDRCVQGFLTEAEANLSTVAVSFIEQPQYRLAGAEEALTQITVKLNETVENLEQECRHKIREATDNYARLFPIIGGLSGSTFLGRRGTLTSELRDLLTAYPLTRYRVILLSATVSFFRKLRDSMPEYMRDVSFCRAKLEKFESIIGSVASTDPGDEPGAFVLPIGCETLDAAADQFIADLSPESILQFDQSFQTDVTKKFRGLVNVCLKEDRAERFPDLLITHVRRFLDDRLEKANPAEALARYRGAGSECQSVLEEAYTSAAPNLKLNDKPSVEATILAAPEGPEGDQVRLLTATANTGVEFIPATLTDDILVYREYPRAPLAELPQLGETARQAYHGAFGTDQPPHTRADVEWAPLVKPTT